MTAFSIIWFGQVVSLLGSAMTRFAFTLWAWQKTGQATTLALISAFVLLPTVLFTPMAGMAARSRSVRRRSSSILPENYIRPARSGWSTVRPRRPPVFFAGGKQHS